MFRRPCALFSLFGLAAFGAGCGGRTAELDARPPTLLRVEAGRLVDVYGLRSAGSGILRLELFARDRLAGVEIRDQRSWKREKLGASLDYDFLGVDPATLHQRLLIPHEIGSLRFAAAFGRVDDELLQVQAPLRGEAVTVVPRDAALRLVFSRDLGRSQAFFDANPGAVRLETVGGTGRIPLRVAYQGRSLVLDPVLCGDEGERLGTGNNGLGLPPSLDASAANLRIVLAIPTLSGVLRAQRDFRSGNEGDESLWLAKGFCRESIGPRLLGALPMRLERVVRMSKEHMRLTVYKAGIVHEIDRGDTLRLFPEAGAKLPAASAIVVAEPGDDEGEAGVQHVVVEVPYDATFVEQDPSRRPDWPKDPKEREAWLMKHAPLLVLATEFEHARGKRDEARWFLRFAPEPRADPVTGVAVPNERVSPFAAPRLSFSRPIDVTTLRPYDSFVLAATTDTRTVLDPKKGTPFLIASRVYVEDGSQARLRSLPSMGFYLDEAMRAPGEEKRYPYALHLVGGTAGIRDIAGNALDLQTDTTESLAIPFWLDVERRALGGSFEPDNRVANVVRRFNAVDEDESRPGQRDWFGAGWVAGGRLHGAPTRRFTSFVDDRNQRRVAPCSAGMTAHPTGKLSYWQPSVEPFHPLGCRLQTVWREADLSLAFDDPAQLNLDVEQIWWAPYQGKGAGASGVVDVFDRMSLFLGHAERRPSACRSVPSLLPGYHASGLDERFELNYARNLKVGATDLNTTRATDIETRPEPHPAFLDRSLVIRPADRVLDPSGTNRFLPLPSFGKERGLFRWRDERLASLGGGMGPSKIPSPFSLDGWNGGIRVAPEEGRVGAIALPLLADFQVWPDDPKLPKRSPSLATGANGFQLAVTTPTMYGLTLRPEPVFRVFSAGGTSAGQKVRVFPGAADGSWRSAKGGFTIGGSRTPPADSAAFWTRVDLLARSSVFTFGFVSLADPHLRSGSGASDPRLGPYEIGWDEITRFEPIYDPPLSQLAAGVAITPGFRGASRPSTALELLNPLPAGDAHVRSKSSVTQYWEYAHSIGLTRYVADPNQLFASGLLAEHRIPRSELRYLNFRFVFENDPVAEGAGPSLDSFALAYRIEPTAPR